jgi:pSer/pThr/pTyr-binding forkhead associated (FHA) protein
MALLAQLIDDVVASRFELDKPKLTIGRHPDCDIQITDSAVSGKHALIEVEANKHLDGVFDIFISDAGSTNGSFVNEEPLSGRRRLNNNDVIRIAWNSFHFIEDQSSDLEKTAYTLTD